MFNLMLDRLPEDYNGWLIRTDYRIGVQIQLCISDPDLSDPEKTAIALHLLYGNGIPDMQTAMQGLSWFMGCGSPQDGAQEDSEPPVYSFEYDAARLVSGFKRVFGVDLSRARLHWFEFVPMLGDLSGTAFANVLEIRQTSAAEIDAKRRSEFIRMKQRFALPNQYTSEETETINSILEQARAEPVQG